MDIVGGVVASLCEAYNEIVRFDSRGYHVNMLFDHENNDIKILSPYTNGFLVTSCEKIRGPICQSSQLGSSYGC